MTRPTVSATLILKNNGAGIRRALDSINGLYDELVCVIDTASTDATEEIVREEYDAKVIRQDWLGFASQRNVAILAARCDWCLVIDGDEELVDRGDAGTLLTAIEDDPDPKRPEFVLWRVETVKEATGAIGTSELQPRVFRRNLAIRYRFEIHNQLHGYRGAPAASTARLRAYYPDSYEERWERNEGRLLAYRAAHPAGSPEWRHATLYLARGSTCANDLATTLRYCREAIEDDARTCHPSIWPLYCQALARIGGDGARERVREVIATGLAAQPENADLRWWRFHEAAQDWLQTAQGATYAGQESWSAKWLDAAPEALGRVGIGVRRVAG